MCREWGEAWVAPRVVTYDLNDMLSPSEAADVAAVGVATIRQWRARGLLTGTHASDGWRYRARDVLAVVADLRRRS